MFNMQVIEFTPTVKIAWINSSCFWLRNFNYLVFILAIFFNYEADRNDICKGTLTLRGVRTGFKIKL